MKHFNRNLMGTLRERHLDQAYRAVTTSPRSAARSTSPFVGVRRIAQKGGKYLAGGFDKAVSSFAFRQPIATSLSRRFENMDKAKAWYEGGQRELERTVASKYADFRVIAVEGAN